jgi:branched-chain amino acid transport system ATP-binding protein
VPEGRRVFQELTVKDNLLLGAYSRSSKAEINDSLEYVYSKFPILVERSKQVAGTLSGGEQQMLAMARALMSRPKLLLMDEPSMGLSPLYVSQIFNTIKEINAEGTTILLVEQNAKQALSIASRAYVLETGNVVMEGKGEDLLHDERIRKAYLAE